MTKNASKYFDNICLVGMPACGKTTFGKVYAHHSNRRFLDFDSFIESVTKKSIQDIFEKKGEQAFRDLESKMMKKIERRHQHVIALGGGTILRQENHDVARKMGLIVWLNTPLDELAARIWKEKSDPKQKQRPLFNDCATLEMVQEKLSQMWEERKEHYQKADIVLNTEFSTLDTLKLQLALIERKASNPKYVRDVSMIMDRKT